MHLQPTYCNTGFASVIPAKDKSGASNIAIPKRQRLILNVRLRNLRSLAFGLV